MPFAVVGAGVLIRLATADETVAVERARRGHGFNLDPERSYRLNTPERPLAEAEVYVVGHAFVDFQERDAVERWASAEHHGQSVSVTEDATMDLLKLAEDAAEGFIDLLGDMGIAGLPISRWELMSAPRRIELTSELQARLAPRRRR